MKELEEKIKKFTSIKDLDEIIKKCNERKWQLINESWEKSYFENCKDAYLTLEQVCSEIKWYNTPKYKGNDLYDELMEHYFSNPYGISELLYYAKILEVSVPPDVARMVCKACTCGGCSGQKECMGFTCEECKAVNYTRYQWVCEE